MSRDSKSRPCREKKSDLRDQNLYRAILHSKILPDLALFLRELIRLRGLVRVSIGIFSLFNLWNVS